MEIKNLSMTELLDEYARCCKAIGDGRTEGEQMHRDITHRRKWAGFADEHRAIAGKIREEIDARLRAVRTDS